MIDTHTHIYLQEFDEDRRAVIDRAEKSGITRMILPNVDVETVGALRQTLNDCSSLCKGAMGLHPTSINQDYKRDLSCMKLSWTGENIALWVKSVWTCIGTRHF